MRRYTESQVLNHLRDLVRWPVTQAEVAKRFGLSSAYISSALKGNEGVSERLAKALGFKKVPDAYVKTSSKGRTGK
jgi:transcriptional regulator with XRE-family HTH domain